MQRQISSRKVAMVAKKNKEMVFHGAWRGGQASNQQDAFLCEALVLSAQAHIALGDHEAAREKLQASQARCPSRSVGTSLYVAGGDLYWAVLETLAGHLSAAWAHLKTELASALERKAELNLANAVAGAALLKAREGQVAQALELYTLACRHPFVAHSRWFADVIGREIEQAAQTLPKEDAEAARETGTGLDIWDTAEKLL